MLPSIGDLSVLSAKLHAKPPDERRIAIIAAELDGDGESVEAAVRVLSILAEAGYRAGDVPRDAATLAARLRVQPIGATPHTASDERLSFADYSAFFAGLPLAVQQRVISRWGPAERDPFFRPGRLDCGHFIIPCLRFGYVAVLLRPSAGPDALEIERLSQDPVLVPPHSALALSAWLNDSFRADAVIDLGTTAAPDMPGLVVWP